MPGVLRSLIVFAATDALVLQPLAQRGQRREPKVQIDYKTRTIARLVRNGTRSELQDCKSLEIHGIIGLLNLLSYSWLITVSGRREVAQIYGRPIYLITDVAFIPLSSQKDAEDAIAEARASARKTQDSSTPPDPQVDDEDDSDSVSVTPDGEYQVAQDAASVGVGAPNSQPKQTKAHGIGADVIASKGLYGRIADRWPFSKGWPASQRYKQGPSHSETVGNARAHDRRKSGPVNDLTLTTAQEHTKAQGLQTSASFTAGGDLGVTLADNSTKEVTTALVPKLLYTMYQLLTSNTFYFSYDLDITTTVAQQQNYLSSPVVRGEPDAQYIWNANLLRPLENTGISHHVLPIMQGFVGQQSFEVETQLPSKSSPSLPTAQVKEAAATPQASHYEGPSLLTLISRRSTNRAGFRYLRRGIDEDGNVANTVETEQILSSADWHTLPVQSYVQTRGSIPLFFTQTPYTFKPLPAMHYSHETNQSALRKHFMSLAADYGNVQAVSLVDRHGSEVAIGEAYEEQFGFLESSDALDTEQALDFHWFDFHQACSGMKFENVSQLVDTLEPFLNDSSWTSIATNNKFQSQSGIIRTNCMDCLDRTNVVQSALGLHTVLRQLSSTSPSASLEIAHSNLWANNGDALSLAYTHTPALKGDYTRHGKRTTLGALTDLHHTLHRYYRNIFDDYFAQAALDYALGNIDVETFKESVQSGETSDLSREVGSVRESAIVKTMQEVMGKIGEDEDALVGGWVVAVSADAVAAYSTDNAATSLLTTNAMAPPALSARPFVDVVLLLTHALLFLVHYDWNTETTLNCMQLPLANITKLQTGTYVTDMRTARQLDPARNTGVLITWQPTSSTTESEKSEECALAFKALPRSPSAPRKTAPNAHTMSEERQIQQIVDDVARAVKRVRGAGTELEVVQDDIVSAEEAKAATTYTEALSERIRRFVWG